MNEAEGLAVHDLTVRYGGAVAVDDLTLAAPLGAITGLIGPNGAGKTTTFNACSGLVTPSSGHVDLLGRDVTRLNPAARARLGLGRTFQRIELCSSLSVLDNVSVAAEARRAGANPIRQVLEAGAQRRKVLVAADEALHRCGIEDLASSAVGDLSTGQRRLVELARVIAGGYRFLLLDEPSSGLDHSETAAFGAILRGLAGSGIGILLVEHDMSLVMSICEHLYVLDFGRLIFTGTASEVQASDVVRSAYLGSDEGLAELAVPQ
jgi:ABC-type branched-subunit amino acid transport system ATPase component